MNRWEKLHAFSRHNIQKLFWACASLALVVGLAVTITTTNPTQIIQTAHVEPASQTTGVWWEFLLCWVFGWHCSSGTPPPPALPLVTISATQTNASANTSTTAITIPLTSSARISATFTPGNGDDIVRSAINGPAPSPVPAGYVWSLAPGVSPTSPVPLTSKTYIFTPLLPGTYVFQPDAYTQVYQSWGHDEGKTVSVTVCPAGSSGPTCALCVDGYGLAGATCELCTAGTHSEGNLCVDNTLACGGGTKVWNNGAWGTCACNAGYILEAGNICVLPDEPLTIAYLTATRVRLGSVATLTWHVTGMTANFSCAITPVPPAGQIEWNGQPIWDGAAQTGPISVVTTYTMKCLNEQNPLASRSVTVTVVPVFQEI